MKLIQYNLLCIINILSICHAIGQPKKDSLSFSKQLSLQVDGRSGKLFFSIGIEHKIARITNRQSPNPLGINIEEQNSGPALLYNLEYFLASRWSMSFEHSLRYGHLIGPTINGLPDRDISTEQFGWFMDYHGAISYAFFIPEPDREWYGSLGLSFINRGKTASYQKPLEGVSQSNEVTDPFIYTYRFGLGYRSKRTHFSTHFYPVGTHHAYPLMSLYIASIKIRYTLGEL